MAGGDPVAVLTVSVASGSAPLSVTADASGSSLVAAAVPGAPTSVSAIGYSGQALVDFEVPSSNGGSEVTSYVAIASTGQTAQSTSGPIAVEGLVNGTPVTFTVRATNAVGQGPASVASAAVTPAAEVYGRPGAPEVAGVAAGPQQVTVSFVPSQSSGSSAITSYTATAYLAGVPTALTGTVAAGGTTIVVAGLAAGTAYTFTVHATNAAGNSAESAFSATVTPLAAVPGAPTAVVATPGNGRLSVAFVAPSSNGGSPITSYTATATPGGVTGTASAGPIVLSGLTNQTSYTVTVRATNAIGNSAWSTPSAAAVPFLAVPTALVATAGNASASVAFSGPVEATAYTATASPGGATVGGAVSPLVVAGLTNGVSYTFTVRAESAAGNSVESAASNAVTPSP